MDEKKDFFFDDEENAGPEEGEGLGPEPFTGRRQTNPRGGGPGGKGPWLIVVGIVVLAVVAYAVWKNIAPKEKVKEVSIPLVERQASPPSPSRAPVASQPSLLVTPGENETRPSAAEPMAQPGANATAPAVQPVSPATHEGAPAEEAPMGANESEAAPAPELGAQGQPANATEAAPAPPSAAKAANETAASVKAEPVAAAPAPMLSVQPAKTPPQPQVKEAMVKKPQAAGHAAGAFTLQAGAYLQRPSMGEAERLVRKLGYEPKWETAERPVKMVRLRVGAFSEKEAKAKLKAIAHLAPGAFVVSSGGQSVVYAGSFSEAKRAHALVSRLRDEGVQVKEEKVEVKVPIHILHFGEFPDRASATKVAEKARKTGLEVLVRTLEPEAKP